MRILHTSDWHLGRTLEGRSRLVEQRNVLEEMTSLCSEEAIDLVLVAGDVFDAYNPPAAAEELYYEYLERMADGGRRAVVVVAGNHDSPERIRAANPLAVRHGISLMGLPGDHLPGSVGVGRVRRLETGPGWLNLAIGEERVGIVGLPYPSESRLREVLSREMADEVRRGAYSDRVGSILKNAVESLDPSFPSILVGHFYVAGGIESESERPIHLGGALTVDAESIPAEFSYVALGHLHRAQRVGGFEHWRYSGSPLAYSFSEATRGDEVTLVDVGPDGVPEVRRSPLSGGIPLVKRRVKGWDSLSGVIEEVGRAWFDLEVEVDDTPSPELLARIRREYPEIVIIRVSLPRSRGRDAGPSLEDLTLEEQFRKFYLDREGTEPSSQLVELFLELVNEEGEEPT